jgi:hypothetical protein
MRNRVNADLPSSRSTGNNLWLSERLRYAFEPGTRHTASNRVFIWARSTASNFRPFAARLVLLLNRVDLHRCEVGCSCLRRCTTSSASRRPRLVLFRKSALNGTRQASWSLSPLAGQGMRSQLTSCATQRRLRLRLAPGGCGHEPPTPNALKNQ